jgi:hypothetical protein
MMNVGNSQRDYALPEHNCREQAFARSDPAPEVLSVVAISRQSAAANADIVYSEFPKAFSFLSN